MVLLDFALAYCGSTAISSAARIFLMPADGISGASDIFIQPWKLIIGRISLPPGSGSMMQA
jgi:hypothetical protein